MTRALALVLLVAAAGSSGCGGGGGGSAQDVLAKTAGNLGKIRSGTLHVELLVTPRGQALGGATGFRIDGPFSLASGTRLPVARVAYTQIASGKQATVTIVSTGRTGYVETGGKAYELSARQSATLQSAAGQLDSSGKTGKVALDSWIRDPKRSDGGSVGGAETDRVTAGLNVAKVVNDLLLVARASGQDVPQVQGKAAQRLSSAVRSSGFELLAGKKDHLLRKATVDVDFAFDVPQNLRRALGTLVGAKIRFVLSVSDPNSSVHVQAPANPLPASAQPSG